MQNLWTGRKHFEEFRGVEGLVEAIEDFELKTGLLLAACMISMKDGSSLKKV